MFPTEYKDGTITFTTTIPTPNHNIYNDYYKTVATYPIVWKEWKSPFDIDPELITFDLPKKYIINDKVCVLVWEDGSMTKIKKSPDDEFDPVKAFLWAWFQHTCGLPKWKANNYLREVEETSIHNITKKRKKKKEVVEEL